MTIAPEAESATAVGWLMVILAGLVEIAWAQAIRPTQHLSALWPSVVCFALVALVTLLLSLSMQTMPVGTAYTVFTAIGTVGTIGIGVLIHREPMHAGRLAALSLICVGVVLAHLTE